MTQIIKNFDSFINENTIKASPDSFVKRIPEVKPNELNHFIKALRFGEKIIVFTNWAAIDFAIPHMCKSRTKGEYIQIDPSILNVADFDNSNSLPNLPNDKGQIIYISGLEKTDRDVLKQLMQIILTDDNNAYVVSINMSDENYKDVIDDLMLDRIDRMVRCY